MSGKSFEAWIVDELNSLLMESHVIAWQLPTPYKILRVDGHKFTGVFTQSTIDFIGAAAPDGKMFGFEAKETGKDGKLHVLYRNGQRGDGLKRHQINTLAHIAKMGGRAFVVVRDSKADEVYALPVTAQGKIGSFKSGSKTLPLATQQIFKIASIRDLFDPQ